MAENLFYLVDSDNNFNRIGTLDHHIKNFNWTEDMMTDEGGSFEIVLSDDYLRPLLANELFVQNTKCFKVGFITSIQVKKDKGAVQEIKVSGKMAEYILTRRHVKKQMQLQGNAKQIITDLMNINVINTKSSIINIPIKLNFVGNIPSDTYEYGFESGKKVSEALREICGNLNMFYYFTIENGGLVLNFKQCEDKTYMVFASDDSNLNEITILDTIENKANCVIVKGDIINSSVPYAYSVLQGKKGIHVSEDFLDESNFDSKDVESSLYLKMLQKKGNNKLMSYQIMKVFDSATIKNKYTYPTELFLGDVVTVHVEGETQRQRLVSFLHCMNSDNKEEFIFTLAQMPELISATDEEYHFEDVPDEELDKVVSDATSNNANPSAGGGSGVEVVGRVLCIDNPKVDGSIIKLQNGLYRLNIFTWNSNPNITITNESGTTTEKTVVSPYSGKIYFKFPNNLLSYINQNDGILYIDNFDGSKTKIDINSGYKGVLFADELAEGHPLLFENPTEQNADADTYYEYDIESENLNFNFTADISLEPVKNTVPLKPYSKTVVIPLRSFMGKGVNTNDCVYSFDKFLPENFVADEGDFIKLKCTYAPIKHTNDPTYPYTTDGNYEIKEFIWTFRKGERVKDKVIRLPEGAYDFINNFEPNHWWTCSFKKLDYLKSTQSSHGYSHFYGTASFGYNLYNTYPQVGTLNCHFLIKQDPAFDSIDGLDGIRWQWFEQWGNDTTKPNLNIKHDNFALYIGTSIYNASYTLEELCNNPELWESILAEQAAAESTT